MRLLRVIMLLYSGAGLLMLSNWAWLLQRDGGQFVLQQGNWTVRVLPSAIVYAALIAVPVGLISFLLSLRSDRRLQAALIWCRAWMGRHLWLTLLFAIVIVLGAVDVYELICDPYNIKRGFRPWMLRQDIQGWLQLGAAVFFGLALSTCAATGQSFANVARRLAANLRCRRSMIRWWVLAAIVPFVLGAAMALFALEGIAHFSDSLTYLMQGRIMWSGRMFLPVPVNVDLYKASLFFVAVEDRFFGKYPLGWPAIVGTFDHFHVGYLANATLTALTAVLVGLMTRQFAPRRVAVLAVVLFAVSPWMWFNGAHFASHPASMCVLTAFMWLFIRTLRTQGRWSALAAGLCLGAAVLVRPGDAAVFALPAAAVVLYRMVRRPCLWTVLGLLIAVGAMVGVSVYLWQNAVTTGFVFKSPYQFEARWGGDWNRTPLETLGRFMFQWAELNRHFPGWGIGGLTVAVLGAIAGGLRWRHTGLRLLAACSLFFLVFNAVFGFTTVWWGPRWLVPMVPLLVVLAAGLVDRMIQASARPGLAPSQAGQLGLCVLAGGVLVGLGVYGGTYWLHRAMPPHLVSASAHRQAVEMGLGNAVVAMPPVGDRPPLDARAGMVFMDAPFGKNTIIYVRAISGWPHDAAKEYPGRRLYELVADSTNNNGFVIKELQVKNLSDPPSMYLGGG